MPGAFLRKIVNGSSDISRDEFRQFLKSVSENKVSSPAVVAFITALSVKEPESKDLLWFAEFVLMMTPPVSIKGSSNAFNIVGTGGGLKTFNISTASAFVASAAGATVIKSGSYSYSGQSGSLDVLKALGIKVHATRDSFERMVDELQIGFVNPEWYSPLLRRMAISLLPLTLRDIGKFINIIGPLICPIETKGRLIGVSSSELMNRMSEVAAALDLRNTVICWSETGIDELCSIGRNHVRTVDNGIRQLVLEQERFGFAGSDVHMLHGGDPASNAELISTILQGKIKGEQQETVVLNSAYLLFMAGIVKTVEEGVDRSRHCLESGSAFRKLREASAFSKGDRYHTCSLS